MAEEIQREIQRLAMDSSSRKGIDTDFPQNRLDEDHLLKLKIGKDKNAKNLQANKMDDLFKLEEENKQLLKEIQCEEEKLNVTEEEIESSNRKLKGLTGFFKKLLKKVAEFLVRYGFEDEDHQGFIEEYLQIYNVTREELEERYFPKDDEAQKNGMKLLLMRIRDLIPDEMLKKDGIDDVKFWS